MGSTAPKGQTQLPMQSGSDNKAWKREAHNWLLHFNGGKIANTGQLTLSINANATTVMDTRAGNASHIGFMPTTPHAAVEWRNLVVSGQGDGFFTVSHANNAVTDRTFTYCIMG